MINRMMFNVAFVMCKALRFNALFDGVWFSAWLRCTGLMASGPQDRLRIV